MELDVCLSRTGDEPWGFRLIGGTDFGMPLTVLKVLPDSPADLAGLRNGDTVSRIDDAETVTMTHEQSRQSVAAAGNNLSLTVVRGLYDPVLDDTEPLYESTDQLTDQSTDQPDFDQPLRPTEVDYDPNLTLPRFIEQPGPLPLPDLLDQKDLYPENLDLQRSLTSSPFVPQLKPYRPFSTEPLSEVPPLEDPIILNPEYQDVFSRILGDEDFLPVTRFKLPISEQYDPDGTKKKTKVVKDSRVSEQGLVTKQEVKTVEESQMKNQKTVKCEEEIKEQIMSKEEIAFLEEMKKEIDVEKIEMTASSIVDESIEKAVTVAEEIKKEIAVELNETSNTESTVKESSQIESKLASNEITESYQVESHAKSKTTQEAITNETATKEVMELVELLDKTTDNIMKEKVEENYEQVKETAILDEQEKTIKEFNSTLSNTELASQQNTASIEELSVIDQQESLIQESNAKTNAKSSKKSSQETVTSTDKKYSTSKLLAEQRAYVIGLQTIPNIRGAVHSSYHYDLLLKTFFIHLTDVMVALSRFILAEPVLSTASEGQKLNEKETQKDITHKVQETVTVVKKGSTADVKMQDTQIHKQEQKDVKELVKAFAADNQETMQKEVKMTAKEEQKSAIVKVNNKFVQEQKKTEQQATVNEETQHVKKEELSYVDLTEKYAQEAAQEVSKKLVSGSKIAQMTTKKSEDLMQKMEAVLTEFESKAGGEDINLVKERRSRSRSRADSRAEVRLDEYSEENRMVGEEISSRSVTKLSSATAMSSSLSESTTTRKSRYESSDYDTAVSTGDNKNYIAIVEAHVYTNKDAIFDENVAVNETTSAQKQAVEVHEAVKVEKPVVVTKTAEKTVEKKKIAEVVDSKKATVEEKKGVLQKVAKDRNETKIEEVKQSVQKAAVQEMSFTNKEEKIETKIVEIQQSEQKTAVQDLSSTKNEERIEAKVEKMKQSVQHTAVQDSSLTKKEENIEAKIEETKQSVQKTAIQDTSLTKKEAKIETKVEDTEKLVQKTAFQDTSLTKKKEKIELSTALASKEEKVQISSLVAKEEHQQQIAEVSIAKEVIKEKADDLNLIKEKKVNKEQVVIEEIIEPLKTQETMVDQDYLCAEAKEEVSSAASETAVATEAVTAQLVAAAEKLSAKQEVVCESTVGEIAKIASVESKEQVIVAKSVNENVKNIEAKKQETVAIKEEKAAAREISTTKSVVAESTATRTTKQTASEENKTAEIKKEKVHAIVAIEDKKDVTTIKKEAQEFESTFVVKKQETVSEENTKAVSIQEKETEMTVEKESKELYLESKNFNGHTEINHFESQHIEQESTFVAKSEAKDLKLALNTDLAKQDSKTSIVSDGSNTETPSSTVPPTPLTDEYIFKLEIPLPKLSAPPPPRDCTPSDDEDDLHIVNKGLVPVVESEIEDQTIFDPPLPTPPVTPGSPRSPASPRSPVYTKPGLKGGAVACVFFKQNAHQNIGNLKPLTDEEDPHIVKKALLPIKEAGTDIASLTTNRAALQTNKDDEDPHVVKKDSVPRAEGNKTQISLPLLTSPVTPTLPITNFPSKPITLPVYFKPGLRGGAPGFFGFPRSFFKFPAFVKPGLKGGADRDYTQEEILEIERKSSLLASAIDETIKSIEEYKEEVGINQETTASETTNGVIYNGYAKVVETKVFKTSEEKTSIEANFNAENHEEVKIDQVNDKMEATESKTETVSFENGKVKFASPIIATIETEDVKIQNVEDKTKQTDVKIDNNDVNIEVTHNGIAEPVPPMETLTKAEIMEEAKRDPMEGYKSVHFDPEELLYEQLQRKAMGVRVPQLTASQERELYKTETGELIGTRQGIVDGLTEAVVDPDLQKEIGKPGISEEKIAELISGESEMLREAHVMGLTRVLKSRMNKDDDSSVDFKRIKPIVESLKDSEVLRALNEELLKTHEEKKKEEQKKWTTFLQKPKRPVPKNKFGYYPPDEEIGEPYKVKIVKQPKPKVAPDYKPKDFNTGLLPWEERALREPTPPPVAAEDPILIPEEAPEILEAVDPLPESEVPDLEDSGIPLPPPETKEPTPPLEETAEEQQEELDLEAVVEETEKIVEESLAEEMERTNIAEQLIMSVQNMVDPNATLEQQLAQMRAQLAALAQLPGVIQHSLELVTQQLSQLSQLEASQANQKEVTQETLTEEVQETEVTQNGDAEQTATIEELPAEQENQPEVADQTAVEKTLTPEELERMRREEEAMLEEQRRLEKQKKDYKEVIVDYVDTLEAMEQARLERESRQVKQHATPRVGRPKPAFGPATPQERPLVLPGGRRWRKPQDAYNEQFIAETLQAQAEIIAGKAKGMSYESVRLPYDERINFMKYEKPPVSLDHLQHSDVYKMIHSMDQTPLKRVDMLTPVMAECDYREKCRSMTPCAERLAQQVQP